MHGFGSYHICPDSNHLEKLSNLQLVPVSKSHIGAPCGDRI